MVASACYTKDRVGRIRDARKFCGAILIPGEKTGAGGALRRRLLTEGDDIALRASNHDKKAGIPDCDLAAVRLEQVFGVARSSPRT